MRTADTSLIVAAFVSWHEKHDAARRARWCASLAARFPRPLLRLSPKAYREFLLGLPERDVAGGAAYDALVAATAAGHRAELLTCDISSGRSSRSAFRYYTSLPTHGSLP